MLLQADTVDETVQWLRGYLAMLDARTPAVEVEPVLAEPVAEPALVAAPTAAAAVKL